MHEIPPMAEQILRDQGITDSELDKLRQTGALKRADNSGATINIRLGTKPDASLDASTIWIDGMMTSGPAIPQDAVEKLRRFHRFIPDHVVQNLELATGHDIDGDGQVGGGGSPPAPPVVDKIHSVIHHVDKTKPTEHAASSETTPAADTSGPFVQRSTSSKIVPALIVLGIVVAIILILVIRF